MFKQQHYEAKLWEFCKLSASSATRPNQIRWKIHNNAIFHKQIAETLFRSKLLQK